MAEKSYVVLGSDAYVKYRDGNEAEDYVCIGIVESHSPEDAVTRAVENISPMSPELAESTEFLVLEIQGDRHYVSYERSE